jgi:RNA polymerase sigma-70 factor (ECF subfamily)
VTGPSVNKDEGAKDTPSSLLEQVKCRDTAAWQRLVHLFSPLVYRWCRQAGLQEADAADVGQEVFKAVFGGIGSFRHDRDGDTLGGWLRTITANKVRDFQRKLAKRDRGVGGSDAQRQLREITEDKLPGSDEDSLREDNLLLYRRAVEMILAGCEEQTRQVFLRVVIERQAASAVAREMGITVNAVYLAKSRVLRRIRQEFAGVVKV